LEIWEKIAIYAGADAFAKLTRTCRWVGRLWHEKNRRNRILAHFIVLLEKPTTRMLYDFGITTNWRNRFYGFPVVGFVYHINGRPHQTDGTPAIGYDSSYEWWEMGRRHRDGDRPAVITSCQKEWWRHGKRHRDGWKPAIIDALENKRYFKYGWSIPHPRGVLFVMWWILLMFHIFHF